MLWNDAYLRLFPELKGLLRSGLDYQATLHRYFEASLAPDRQPFLQRYLEAAMARHREQAAPYIFQRRDGTWLRVEARRLPDGGVLKLWTDVTAEQSLLAARSGGQRNTILALDIGFAQFDRDGRFITANRALVQLFPDVVDLYRPGVTYRDYLLRLAERALAESEAPRLEALMGRPEPAAAPVERPLVLGLRDGGWVQLEERIGDDGGLFSTWIDVTGRIRSETELATMRQRLDAAIESMSEGFALFDAHDALVHGNARCWDLIGAEGRPGMPYQDILAAAVAAGHFPKAGATGDRWLDEQMSRHRQPGAPMELAVAGGLWIRIAERRTAEGGTVMVVSDITPAKRREDELTSRSARLASAVYTMAARTEAIVHSARDGIVTFSMDTLRITSFNRAAEQMFGCTASQASGQPVADLIDAGPGRKDGGTEDGSGVTAEALLVRLLAGELTEVRGRCADGGVFDMEVSVARVDAGTEGAFYTAIFRNVSRRKQAEEALRQSERRFRDLIEGSVQGFLIHRDFRPLFVNGAFARIAGYRSAAEILALPSVMDLVPPERWASTRTDYERLVEGEGGGEEGESDVLRLTLRRRDGSLAWVEIIRRTIDWMGEPAVQATVIDVTSKVEAEADAALKSAQLRAAFDAMPNGICMFDDDLRVVVYNRRFRELWDLPESFLAIRPTLADLVRLSVLRGDDGGMNPEAHVAETLAFVRGSRDLHRVHYLASGRTLEVQGRRRPEGGHVLTYLDITQRKRAEESLARQTALLRAVLEGIAQGLTAFDSELRLISWNRRAFEVLGIPQEMAIAGRPFEDFIRFNAERGDYGPGAIEELVRTRVERARVERTPHRFERTLLNGQVVEVQGLPMVDGGFVTTFTDITERKRAEAEIAGKSAILEATLENMSQGIALIGPDGRMRAHNRRVLDLYGIPPEVFAPGQHFTDFIRHLAQNGEYGSVDVDAVVRQRLTFGMAGETRVFEHSRPSGTVLDVRVSPMPDGGFVTTITDITERKGAEEELRAAKERAERAYLDLRLAQESLVQAEKMASLGGLVAGIAHEINTPIGITLTAVTHLAEETTRLRTLFDSGQIRKGDFAVFMDLSAETTGLMVTNIHRAAQLIQSFKQVAVDQASAERRGFDLREYIHEVLLSLHPRLRKVAVQVAVNVPEGIEVDGFPGALSQVLSNLVMNSLIHAYDFGAGGCGGSGGGGGVGSVGGISGRLTIAVSQPNPDTIDLRYADDGKGIPASSLPHIFEPFFTTKRGAGGSGLGLNIVYNLVTKTLHGQISVESTPGRGSVFMLRFPRVAPLDNSADTAVAGT